MFIAVRMLSLLQMFKQFCTVTVNTVFSLLYLFIMTPVLVFSQEIISDDGKEVTYELSGHKLIFSSSLKKFMRYLVRVMMSIWIYGGIKIMLMLTASSQN